MDLALAHVEEDLGRTAALEIARHLVMFVRRPGGQSQFSPLLEMQAADRRTLARLVSRARPDDPQSPIVVSIPTRHQPTGGRPMLPNTIAGISIPDSALAVEATELVRDTESELLFDHSLRVYLFGALQGRRLGFSYDPELLYIGAIFHDLGLTEKYRSPDERFEVDGANAARRFLERHGVPESSIEVVWDAIALHTTPGIPKWKKPEVALVTAGVELDVLGLGYDDVPSDAREQVLAAFPRVDFKRRIVRAFADGIAHKPQTAFGNVKADVLEKLLPGYVRPNFCEMIAGSPFRD